ncbi:MAG: DUF4386 family protein [Pseudomonadota bacterium]
MIFQRISGASAIVAGLTYIIGFWVYFSILGPAQYGSPEIPATQHVEFLAENQDLMSSWNLVIYILNAVLMVFIVIGLYHRIKTANETLAQAASVFGIIWAGLILAAGMVENLSLTQIVRLSEQDMEAAATLWRSTVTIGAGLGGGNEITGGMWIFLLSLAGFQVKSIPTPVNIIGIVVGGAGILSTFPPLADATMIFGLGFILWFFAIGIVMIVSKDTGRPSTPPA